MASLVAEPNQELAFFRNQRTAWRYSSAMPSWLARLALSSACASSNRWL
jgi:hypothetical protein